jgi:hypothetical protein
MPSIFMKNFFSLFPGSFYEVKILEDRVEHLSSKGRTDPSDHSWGRRKGFPQFRDRSDSGHRMAGEWSPTGKARGTSLKYPPTPLGAEALRRASAKALACQRTCSASRSAGYPPVRVSDIRRSISNCIDPRVKPMPARRSACLRRSGFAQAGVTARRRGLLRRRIKGCDFLDIPSPL